MDWGTERSRQLIQVDQLLPTFAAWPNSYIYWSGADVIAERLGSASPNSALTYTPWRTGVGDSYEVDRLHRYLDDTHPRIKAVIAPLYERAVRMVTLLSFGRPTVLDANSLPRYKHEDVRHVEMELFLRSFNSEQCIQLNGSAALFNATQRQTSNLRGLKRSACGPMKKTIVALCTCTARTVVLPGASQSANVVQKSSKT